MYERKDVYCSNRFRFLSEFLDRNQKKCKCQIMKVVITFKCYIKLLDC